MTQKPNNLALKKAASELYSYVKSVPSKNNYISKKKDNRIVFSFLVPFAICILNSQSKSAAIIKH